MSPPPISIRPFDFKAASPEEYAAYNRFANLMQAERLPDDPPTPVEELIARMQNLPPVVTVHTWVAWDAESDQIVASATIQILHMAENQHLAPIQIDVLPDYRRQGLGRRLLSLLVPIAQAENRRLLMAESNERVPAGGAFLQHLGAQPGLASHTNQLALEQVDPTLIQRWLERADALNQEFELGFWEGPYPEEELEAVAHLMRVLDDQPTDELEIEAFKLTPDLLRQMEQMLFAAGGQRWTCYVRERASGEFAGYTDVTWRPSRPHLVEQGGTGVFPRYRNRGLGRWLKATMLARLMQQRPETRYIRTGNADANGPMLKINRELGFQPYISETAWQVETTQVQAYLQNSITARKADL